MRSVPRAKVWFTGGLLQSAALCAVRAQAEPREPGAQGHTHLVHWGGVGETLPPFCWETAKTNICLETKKKLTSNRKTNKNSKKSIIAVSQIDVTVDILFKIKKAGATRD